jgi:hypothetical protein
LHRPQGRAIVDSMAWNMSGWSVVVGLAVALGWSGSADGAQAAEQPGDPVGNSLQNLFNMLADPINALNDAKTTPETFVPACEVQLQGASAQRRLQELFRLVQHRQGQADPRRPASDPRLQRSASIRSRRSRSSPTPPTRAARSASSRPWAIAPTSRTPPASSTCSTASRKHNPDAQNMNPFIHLIVYDMHIAQNSPARSYT